MSASELGQVLINVVANGAHAIGARGATGHVSITAQEAHGMLELQVRDNGVGVTRREDNTGLGVGQCERILAIAGGRLHIANEPGIGTVVTITLPTAA
jgi:signal transduction histidine kinase